ncbi:MAG: DUF805 domain-containing protein [Alteraurantiacibacter sp.]
MINAVKYCLARLGDFAGRDGRPTFWWYVLFLVVMQFVLGFLASIPLLIETAGTAMDAAQAGIDGEALEERMLTSMGGSLTTTGYISAAITGLVIVLIAAALVRRIRDAGLPGWLALVPLALQVAAVVGSLLLLEQLGDRLAQLRSPAEMEAFQQEMMLHWSSIAGWLSYLAAFVFGILPSRRAAD